MEKTPKTGKRKRKKSNGPENVEEKTGDGKALAADAEEYWEGLALILHGASYDFK